MRIGGGDALFAGSLAVLAGHVSPILPDDVDPVFAAAYNGCVSALNNGGFVAADLGWTGHDSGDPDAQLWKNHTHGFATKDVEAGGLNLSASRIASAADIARRESVDFARWSSPVASFS